jgi:signal transduction histidine kinase
VSPSRGAPASHADVASAIARLFERARDGLYVGVLGAGTNPDITLAANTAARSLLGYPDSSPASEFRPFSLTRFSEPAERAALLEQLRKDGCVKDYLLRLRRDDQSTIDISVTAVGRPDATGGIVAEIQLVAVDGTGHRTTGGHAERMAALGQTVSGVAHELNNPLTTIINWSERLIEHPGQDVRRGLEMILSEGRRAARVVRNLLMFSHKRESTRRLIDINQIVRDTLGLRALDHRSTRVDVVADLTPSLPQVLGDSDQIQQVLLNLCINAEQAMVSARGSGLLTVRTVYDTRQQSIALTVADDGPGIPPQTRAHVFEPFFTTKSAGNGTGLGLTVARAIAREHGGEIRLEPPNGPGAAFTVVLPAARPATQ